MRSRLAAVTALGVVLCPKPASADSLQWLAPARAPAGQLTVGLTLADGAGNLQLPSGAKVEASHRLEEQAARGPVRVFLARPGAGVLDLKATLAGTTAAAKVAIGAPAAKVVLSAKPENPVKGKDESAALQISVLRGGGTEDPESPLPVVRTNVGVLASIEPAGAGRFQGRYVLPKTRYPEVAILVAFSPWPHADAVEGPFGALALPLSSAVNLPGKTEPNVEIAVEIAGQTFGPVRADAKGRFEIPVIVPPGHRWGTSVTTDRLGNRRRKKIDLRLPPTDRIACVANPLQLPADGASQARVLCVATDPFGEALSGARLVARAKLGSLTALREVAGPAYEWAYTAPASLDVAAVDELEFDYPAGGPQSSERVTLRLARACRSRSLRSPSSWAPKGSQP